MGLRIPALNGIALAAGAVVAGLFVAAPARAADEKGVAFFEANIRPILANTCVNCHGPEKQKGGLRMDTRENLLKGGEDKGKQVVVVVPGDPAKSLIVEAIEYKDEDKAMPPPKKGKSMKLPDDQIAAIKEWVKLGAPYGEKAVEPVKKNGG